MEMRLDYFGRNRFYGFQRLEKLDDIGSGGFEPGKTVARTCWRILASLARTGEIDSFSSSSLMVRSNKCRRVFSLTNDDSSGCGDVNVAASTSILPNCLFFS